VIQRTLRQFVCDNADRNPWTLDGKKALHAMGIIETITPSVKAKALIKRTGASTVSTSVIPVMYYNSHEKNSSIMYYKLPPEDVTCHTDSIDLLWKISASLKPGTSNWSGVMHMVSTSCHYPGKCTVRFLPMLNMNPTDMNCVYSTLCFITNECMRHGCTPKHCHQHHQLHYIIL